MISRPRPTATGKLVGKRALNVGLLKRGDWCGADMIFRVIGIRLMFAALLGGVAGLAGLAGCDRQSTSASSPASAVASDKEPVHVLATVYLLADIARQIGGDQVDAEWYVE